MRSRSLAAATVTCAALAVAAPAYADTGNNASGSTGVVQIGPVTADPSVDVATPFGGVTATTPGGSTSSGGGANTTSGSTGVVQSSPFSTRPRAHLSTRTSSITVSAPAAVGAGGNSASSTTGAVQFGGGNSSSSSTGTVQVSGIQASPTATATPSGGDSSTVGLTAGVAGSGNTAGNSTGAVQVGGGNTSTGSLGSGQSSAPTVVPELELATPPGASGLLQFLSVGSAPGGAGGAPSGPGVTSAAGVAGTSPIPAPVAAAATHPVRTQVTKQGALVQAQGTHAKQTGVLGRAQALAGRVVAGTLPFTGRNLALLMLAGIALVGTGMMLRRRGVAVR